MHVCFLNLPIEFYSPVSGGAISTIIAACAKELTARGHGVDVLTIANGDPHHPYGRVIPIRSALTHPLPLVPRKFSGLAGRWRRWEFPHYGMYARSYGAAIGALPTPPDAVIAFNDLAAPYYLRKFLPRTRLVTWLQNEWRSRFRGLSRSLAAVDILLACSDYIRDWTLRQYRISAEKVISVPSGVDLEQFHPRPAEAESGGPLRVLFLGRIDPNKGPDLAADAVQRLRARGAAVELTVAGGLWFYGHGDPARDPFFRLLREKIERAGGTYVGPVTRDKVPALIRSHDVVMVLSRSNEPFGLVVLEAMACGCAVIASDRGGLPQACGGAAQLVNPDSMDQIEAALMKLATQREFLAQQKRGAWQRAQGATWSHAVERLLGVLGQSSAGMAPTGAAGREGSPCISG